MSARLAILLVLAACASDETYDDAVADYIEVACTSDCRSGTEEDCRAEVAEELARVELTLDHAGKLQCMACLHTKARLLPELEACTPNADQTAEVIDACDLDTTIDSDGDGIPDNDYSQACGGHP